MPEELLLIALSSAYAGIDTMVTHLSAAVGKATVAVFGPTPVVRWGPWVNGLSPTTLWSEGEGAQRIGHVTVVRGACDRMGCEHRRDSFSRCLDDLTPEAVHTQLENLLSGGPPES